MDGKMVVFSWRAKQRRLQLTEVLRHGVWSTELADDGLNQAWSLLTVLIDGYAVS